MFLYFLHIFQDCMLGLKVLYLQTTVFTISLWITCVYALVDRCTCEIEKPRDVFLFEKSSVIGPLGSDQRPSLFCLDVGEQNVRKDHWPRLKVSCHVSPKNICMLLTPSMIGQLLRFSRRISFAYCYVILSNKLTQFR